MIGEWHERKGDRQHGDSHGAFFHGQPQAFQPHRNLGQKRPDADSHQYRGIDEGRRIEIIPDAHLALYALAAVGKIHVQDESDTAGEQHPTQEQDASPVTLRLGDDSQGDQQDGEEPVGKAGIVELTGKETPEPHVFAIAELGRPASFAIEHRFEHAFLSVLLPLQETLEILPVRRVILVDDRLLRRPDRHVEVHGVSQHGHAEHDEPEWPLVPARIMGSRGDQREGQAHQRHAEHDRSPGGHESTDNQQRKSVV